MAQPLYQTALGGAYTRRNLNSAFRAGSEERRADAGYCLIRCRCFTYSWPMWRQTLHNIKGEIPVSFHLVARCLLGGRGENEEMPPCR